MANQLDLLADLLDLLADQLDILADLLADLLDLLADWWTSWRTSWTSWRTWWTSTRTVCMSALFSARPRCTSDRTMPMSAEVAGALPLLYSLSMVNTPPPFDAGARTARVSPEAAEPAENCRTDLWKLAQAFAGGGRGRRPTSDSWRASAALGAPVMGSPPLAVLGNAITSRMDDAPAISITRRSRPKAMPP